MCAYLGLSNPVPPNVHCRAHHQRQRNAIQMVFRSLADGGPVLDVYWGVISVSSGNASQLMRLLS